MLKKSYEAFTLIEMLIVSGILVILMVLSVATARFATERSREVEHRAAAQELFNALQSYASDQILRLYPKADDNTLISMLTKPDGVLVRYLDPDNFKGGQEATYYYFTNADQKKALVCVTLGGINDTKSKGILCVGDGFNDSTMPMGSVIAEKLEYDSVADSSYQNLKSLTQFSSEWDGTKLIAASTPEKPTPGDVVTGEGNIIEEPIGGEIIDPNDPCSKPGGCYYIDPVTPPMEEM